MFLYRNPRPRRRRLDHFRRTSSGQNIRSSLGNDSEHEQSRGFTLQQSQEADIGKENVTFWTIISETHFEF